MGRAPCCDKGNVKKGPWSPEEDAKLKAYIENHGTGGNWIALPQKIGLKRCGKSCRLRWLNYLRPNIKHGGFTEEEDNIICNLYISIGSRWSIIAAQLPGRTDNDIKNYWNTRLKKKLLGRRKQSNNVNPKDANGNEIDENSSSSYSNALSNSALERLQLHIQLQSLQNQNPFSFYNNPALLWPKSHPFQPEKIMTQISSGSSSNPVLQKEEFYKPTVAANSLQQDDDKIINSTKVFLSDNSINTLSSISDPFNLAPRAEGNMVNHQVSALQAELNDILNNRTMASMPQEEAQMADFDCFGEMNNSKDSLMWWSNDLDTKSASSNSWGSTSTPPVLQPEGMFQDYELGYSL